MRQGQDLFYLQQCKILSITNPDNIINFTPAIHQIILYKYPFLHKRIQIE